MRHEEFKNIILPLKDKMFRLALNIIGNKQDAEDVVQDAMLQVWRKKDGWDAINNLEGYCLRTVRNIALDKIALKDNQLNAIPEDIEISNARSEGIVEQMEQTEQLNIIHKLISQLSEKQQTMIQLRDVEGMAYKEIAEIMEISEEQVKVNLFRARQKIKEHFNKISNYGIKKS